MSKEIEKHITQIFDIQELLGSGAYGHVWKVQQKSTKKTYALKKVFDAFQNDIDSQRTYRQITILHELNHPCIIKLKGAIKAQNDKDLYLVFQHMETDLHSLVGQQILELSHLSYIIYQIFKALKYIHSAQLVHRDLKPSNVLINSDCQVKLCDFGLVRSLTREENTQLILSEDVATRWYRSPEMLLGSNEYGWPTDVWSVGCIIAQLIIGEPIMMGGSNIEQLQKILELTGIPRKQEISSIKSPVAQSLIYQFKTLKKPFKHYFKGSRFEQETQLINLIKRMLQFNPQKRITVDQVLGHELFEQIRDKDEQIICKKMIIPQIDDNIRLGVDQYREYIYKDIQRRYPEYNNIFRKAFAQAEQQQQSSINKNRMESIFRTNRGCHSLMNRNSSINSLPRQKATNSLMRQIRNKIQHKTSPIQSGEVKPIQHQSLHCNTVHESNFYKTANSKKQIDYKKQIMGGSLHNNRKNQLVSSIENSKEKIDSTNASTVLQKSPFRKYKKFKTNDKEENNMNKKSFQKMKIDKIEGLLMCKENTPGTVSSKQSKQKLSSTISPKSSINYNINTISKTSFSQNSTNSNQKLYFYDPTSIYRASPPKQVLKKEKNVYKIQQVSNVNKITKKTFTKFRKQASNCNIAVICQNGNKHESGTSSIINSINVETEI